MSTREEEEWKFKKTKQLEIYQMELKNREEEQNVMQKGNEQKINC